MIYTTGTIAVSGNTVTGAGTEFNAALSLIRVGCTLIAISDPVQIFSITEVKSATSLSVTPAASPAIPAGTKFSILLSDSISVDGLAQDVAETLRYYQGKESEIADAVEFFSDNKDVISASKLASESATTATNAATTATTAADSAKTYRDEAHEYANQTAEPYRYVLQPLPDVWIPFNDSLDMITGFSPSYKKIVIGEEETTVPGDKIVKFKRASKATYINKSGVFKEAAIDEPRFEREGLLIEGTRTNYIINGNTPSSWGRSPSVTTTANTDAFGFLYGKCVIGADDVGKTTALNMASVIAANSLDTSGNEKYVTASCRFRSDKDVRLRVRFAEGAVQDSMTFSGDAYIKLSDLSVSKTGGAAERITVEVERDEVTGWNRAVVILQSTTALVNAQFQISPVSSYAAGDYIELTTPQVELGIGASSYIISNTSPTTRASDIATAPIKNNIYNAPFTILCEVHKNWNKTPSSAPRVFDTGGHQTGAAIILAFGSSAEYDGFPYCDIGGSNRRVNENASLQKMIIGMRVKSTYDTCCVSNGRISSETKTTWRYISNAAIFRFGGQTTSGERHLFGHIRNFRVWHKALTDAQLSEIV
ncbi:phage tail protein [Escherichia coli]|uniref:phage head spike fiber domain-containing protein n=1 Tax=Escherichia coli TaxID=562 RepID=UPI0009D9E1D7|nr:phage tail protein [Escherichia coli]MDB7141797.1 phage tail protein [Escherichia coli]MDB7151686.1 phage tail protein [Escherichia coli]MDB7156835.1 phage tail protein [Escherichia coli]MDB7161859.1 phage tail protein [Escherichia coli]MDB7167082.1 phage tail protein [Escherichia coli]